MNLESMIRELRDRTKITDNDQSLVDKLNAALDWAWQRIYLTNPNISTTFATTGTFNVDTTEYDASVYGLKAFWVKGAGETVYTPVVFMDPNDPQFLARTQMSTQVMQPTFAAVINFTVLRFAPTLPSGTMYRGDWISKPDDFSLQTNTVTGMYSEIAPEPIHQSLVSKAEELVFRSIDDTRTALAHQEAEALLQTAIKVIKRRQFQTTLKTKPFPIR